MASVLSAAKNRAELVRLHRSFALRVVVWIWLCKRFYGLDVYIVDGVRSAAQQAAHHAADPRNPARVGTHDGRAVDVNCWRNGKPVLVKGSPAASWRPVYDLAAWCGISNGSSFPGYPDNNHFYRS